MSTPCLTAHLAKIDRLTRRKSAPLVLAGETTVVRCRLLKFLVCEEGYLQTPLYSKQRKRFPIAFWEMLILYRRSNDWSIGLRMLVVRVLLFIFATFETLVTLLIAIHLIVIPPHLGSGILVFFFKLFSSNLVGSVGAAWVDFLPKKRGGSHLCG